MSAIPGNFFRVSNLMQSQTALGNISRTQLALFKVQTQLSTGRSLMRFSDDAARGAIVSVLDERIERASQWLRNFDHAGSSLSTLDQALGDANELLLEAKSIASQQVNLGSSREERQAQAHVVDSLIQSLFGISNRQGVAGHVFGGQQPGTAPVQSLLGGYRYVGHGSGLLTDLGAGYQIPITMGAGSAIGSTSVRVEGAVDLDPNIAGDTRLIDLGGARGSGVAGGIIEFSFEGGPRIPIDLTGADNLGQVVTRIETVIRDYEQANSVTILGPGGVSLNGGTLRFDIVSGAPGPDPSLEFFDPLGGSTAQDLGLTSSPGFSFRALTPDGMELNARLTWRTPITTLRGVSGHLGEIRINNLGQSRIIDLSAAVTIEDIKNSVEGAGLGLRVELNADRSGINIVNEAAAGRAQSLSIEEVSGGGFTATRLGIRSLSGETRIADLNHGRGVQIAHNGSDPITGLPDPERETDFRITLGNGNTFVVDLRPEDMTTVQAVLDRINSQAAGVGISVPADFEAALSDGPNGIVFRQNAAYVQPIEITALNSSPAAGQLGLLDGTYDAGSGIFRATDRATVRVDNLFGALIDLRDALLNDDTSGITLAGEALEGFVARVATSRALVGGYAKRVDDGARELEDRSLLDESTRSNLRDLDYTEAAVRLSMLQTQLQAGLQTTAITQSRTLLDFLG